MVNYRPHKSLKAWQRAIDLTVTLYRTTGQYPKHEEFGLTAQTRRAAVSVASNIAEGMTRKSPKDRGRFLNISQSSLSEIDTQLEIARRVGYLGEETFVSVEADVEEVERLVSGLSRSQHESARRF